MEEEPTEEEPTEEEYRLLAGLWLTEEEEKRELEGLLEGAGGDEEEGRGGDMAGARVGGGGHGA